MPGDASLIADPANGAAIVAGTRVTMSAAANGALRFGGRGGRVLRPLTFGERTELVSAASALPAARDAVAAAILTSATVERGAGATPLMEVLAMWLAGADFDAPDFMQTALLVARAAGWPPQELFTAPAREIDRLAVHLDEQRRAGEWKSLVFAEAPAETIEAVRARFADRLLRRSVAAVGEEEETASAQEARETREDRPVWSAAAKLPLSKAAALLPHSKKTESDAVVIPRRAEAAALRSAGVSPAERAASRRPPGSETLPDQPAGTPALRAEVTASTAQSGTAARLKAAAVLPHSKALRSAGVSPAERAASRRPSGSETLPGQPARTPALHNVRSSEASAVHWKAAAVPPHSKPVWSAAAELSLSAVPESEERATVRFEPRAHPAAPYPDDLAATLALLLDDEADLRGVER